VNFLTIGIFYGTDNLYDEILYAAILSYFQATTFWMNKKCLQMQGLLSHVHSLYSARAFSLGTSVFVFATLNRTGCHLYFNVLLRANMSEWWFGIFYTIYLTL
jgi:hypothetical protein